MSVQVNLRRIFRRVGPVWFAVIIMYAVFGIISPGMLKPSQMLNILQVSAFLGLVTIGQTLALLVGGIDLSVAGVVTLTNIVLASIMSGRSEQMLPAVAVTLVLCVLVGLVNGILISVVGVTPLIVTLATSSVLFGAALVYTGGAPHGSVTAEFAQIGQGHIAGLPWSAVIWLGTAAIMAFVTRKTVFGRRIYEVGANRRAAYVLGTRVNLVVIAVYVLSSLMAGLAGILLTAYINLSSLGIGTQYQFASVAAAVVGGASLTGGAGSILGAVGGTLFITQLNSFTNMIQVTSGVQYLLQGLIIAGSVLLYRSIDRRS